LTINERWDGDKIAKTLRWIEGVPQLRLRHSVQHRDLAERTLFGHVAVVNACAVSGDGKRAVSGAWAWDKALKVWDLETGRELATLTGHSGWVSACAVSGD